MRNIIVATDFSTRSDRAIRRGLLLAKASKTALTLVHAVDDDQPQHLIDMESAQARLLLEAQADTLHKLDGVDASHRIVLGDPFTSIAAAAEEEGSDILIVGPHRRQLLKDIFVGTTAERIIRTCRAPVIMANATPVAPYKHILVAIDLSENSAEALRFAANIDWGEKPAISVFHGFDAPERVMRGSYAVSEADVKRFLDQADARACAEVASFLHKHKVRPVRRIVKMIEAEPAAMIRSTAQEIGADLLVVGRRGSSGLARLILGSVAEAVLRDSQIDVLAVPDASAKTG